MSPNVLERLSDEWDRLTSAGIDAAELAAAARLIGSGRQVFAPGVGVNSANAQNFTCLGWIPIGGRIVAQADLVAALQRRASVCSK
ncbi:MAG: hypothetical protein GY717_02865 [Rhodobacteraceae bacterium]|nr:hypothetical protein [Paracoccaceae bacterium]